VKIAGCKVVEGFVNMSATMRLLRNGELVFEGPCSSLKREKQDVDYVNKGNECGLVISNCSDFQIGDVIQCLEQVVRKPKFIKSKTEPFLGMHKEFYGAEPPIYGGLNYL